jgi:hypothetical protein
MCAWRKSLIVGAIASFIGAHAGDAHAAAASAHAGTFVTATSRFGNGSITAEVRHAPNGWEVLLPGGHWVYCRRNCAETLRVETIDFFNANSAGSGQLTNECGIFGCLDLKYAQ